MCPSTLNETPQSVPQCVFLSTSSSTHLNFPFFLFFFLVESIDFLSFLKII